MFVTIIGSRVTPVEILEYMEEVAKFLMKKGVTLRSGAAGGADSTVNSAYKILESENTPVNMPEIYTPWAGFAEEIQGSLIYNVQGNNQEAMKIASERHPAWDKCSRGAKALHTRNVCQILGEDLKTPSYFVLYYCKERNGNPTGGTATAVNLAKENNISTINMLYSDWKVKITELLFQWRINERKKS